MVAEAPPVGELEARRPFPARLGPKGSLIYKLITTTDHKLIGIMYCVACFIFFFIGGLLALLMRNPRGVVTRELALEDIWEEEATPNAVDRYVAYLRRKLGDPPLIHTVRGIGFRLDT